MNTFIRRLIAIGYSRAEAERLYDFYSEQNKLDDLNSYIVTKTEFVQKEQLKNSFTERVIFMTDKTSETIASICTILGGALLLYPLIDEATKTIIPEMQKLTAENAVDGLKLLPTKEEQPQEQKPHEEQPKEQPQEQKPLEETAQQEPESHKEDEQHKC